MSNLLVSSKCNLRCPYCFADLDHRAVGADFVSLEVFRRMLDYLDRSGIEQVRLLGGEPTLHPAFDRLLQMSIDRGKSILLFTNGIFSERVVATLLALPGDRCTVLVNANSFSATLNESDAFSRRMKILEQLGERCRLGYTIYTPNFSLSPLIALIRETGCSKCIRLGLAQPAGESNRFLHPKNYTRVGQKIVQHAVEAAQDGIRIEFDCGFVRCMFSNQDLQVLQAAGSAYEWRCNPVIDIDLDGTAYSCFPLYGFEPVNNALDMDAAVIHTDFEHKLKTLRLAGVYPECSTCAFRKMGGCTGGCIASALQRMTRTAWETEIPAHIAHTIIHSYTVEPERRTDS
jgi:radical SAM protein with 4Fe4S-binding SPASM domain